MIELTKEQQKHHDGIIEWALSKQKSKPWVSLAGLAGTGKTTLLAFLSHTLFKSGLSKAFCTYTGKASIVLKSKLINYNALYSSDNISTIHSLIYEPLIENDEVVDWNLKSSIPYDIIILDEASMVGKDLWNDLLSFNIPILVSGDHGQNEPIGEESFNLVKYPDFELTEIHRQAKDNPIIKVAFQARSGHYIKIGKYGKTVAKIEEGSIQHRNIFESLTITDDLIFICGTNKTRINVNRFVRDKLNFSMFPHPQPGERIICLKNNTKSDIMNGELGTIEEIKILNDDFYELTLTMEGKEYSQKCLSLVESFNNQNPSGLYELLSKPRIKKFISDSTYERVDIFDYGYCITCHKAQGSEFNKVILFSERNSYQTDDQWNRWLYTGITRASNKLLIIE